MTAAKPHLFEEGQACDFFINSRIQLPPDDENYFVLISSFNTKHLLQEKSYLDYNLQLGQNIICRIDKINCSGKIFLEPEHPVYKEGNVYEFPVISCEQIITSEDQTETIIIVEDYRKHKFYVNVTNTELQNKKMISCRVDRIKKGKLYLSAEDHEQIYDDFKTGVFFDFIIENTTTLAEDEEYFVLRDANNKVHYLRKKYYESYGFSVGDKIKCRYIAQPALFRHYLEPEHPFYKIGESYDFLFSGTESYINESSEEVTKILVSDGSEKDFFVNCDKLSNIQILPGTKIKCRIKDFKMGRPILECI